MPEAFKILVVDDEPDLEPLVLQRMRRRIRSGQYSFVFAQNGLEALDRLREEENIDMVISDINMPQMDGLTLLEQIPQGRSQRAFHHYFRLWRYEEHTDGYEPGAPSIS